MGIKSNLATSFSGLLVPKCLSPAHCDRTTY
jgi:hypothetical protein